MRWPGRSSLINISEPSVPEFIFAIDTAHPYLQHKLTRIRLMELGIYTFADVDPHPEGGRGAEGARRLKNLIEEIELADQVGLDVFGLGEHHRPDYAASAPAVALAAAAVKTKNIRLTSAVTVLSSDDPVRVFQQFATLDLLSN